MRKFIVLFILLFIGFSQAWAQLETGKRETGEFFFPVEQNGHFGYINLTGDVVIPPVFQWADYFYEGYAAAKKGSKYGFINPRGEWKVEPIYDTVEAFSEGVAAIAMKGNDSMVTWGYVDTLGSVIELGMPSLCKATSFHNNRAIVLECGDMFLNFHIINRQGKKVIESKGFYLDENIYPEFSEGYLRVTLPDNSKTFIDTAGNFWNKGSYQDLGNFSEGYAWFMDNGQFGFVDREGKIVVPAHFEVVSNFREGIAKTIERQQFDPSQQKMTNGVVGYINTKGKYVASPQYEAGSDFHNGFALVKLSGFYGFINVNGSAVINFQYAEAKPFYRGLAYVKNEKHWEYINTSGKKVW